MDLFGDADTRAVCEHFERIDAETAADPGRLRRSIADLSRRVKADAKIIGGIASVSCDIAVSDLVAACAGGPVTVPSIITNFEKIRGASPAAQNWLIKKYRSAGGLGVFRWDPQNPSFVESLASSESYLQQRIRGRTFGVVAISNGCETRVLGVSRSLRKRIGRFPFVYAGSIGPWDEPGFPCDEIQQLAHRIARTTRLRGLFNLDLIRDPAGRWWLLEVNSRPSASCEVIERAAVCASNLSEHRSLMGMHFDAIAGHPIQWKNVPSGSVHCKRIVYAIRPGRFQLDRATADIADVPQCGTVIPTGQPIATLLIDSFSPHGALVRRVRSGIRQLQAACR